MTTTRFTQADIDTLGQKIATLELSDGERAVLAAVLAVMAREVRGPDPGGLVKVTDEEQSVVYDKLPDVQTQLQEAFSSGDMAAPGVTGISVGKPPSVGSTPPIR